MLPEQKGKNLLFPTGGRRVLELSRALPGRCKWLNGGLYIEDSEENIQWLRFNLPGFWESNLPLLDKYRTKRRAPPPRRALSNFPFKIKPYEHQLEAFSLMRHAEFFGLGCDMGTGKTKMLLDNAFSLFGEGAIDTVVVLAPEGVHHQWIEEQIPGHAPEAPGFEWEGLAWHKNRKRKIHFEPWRDLMNKEKGEGLVFFTFAYTSVGSPRAREAFSAAMSRGRVMLILDESHKIKTPKAQITKLIFKNKEKALYRRVATGTPSTKNAEDLYSQNRFLDDSILGLTTLSGFRNKYCITRQVPGAPHGVLQTIGHQNMDDLKGRMSPHWFIVKKEDCLDLPEKLYEIRRVPFLEEQEKTYHEMRLLMLAELKDSTIVEAPLLLTRILRLQQILCGHVTDEDGNVHSVPTARPDVLMDIVEGLDGGIIWCRFRHDIQLLSERMSLAGYSVGTYYGDTSKEERRRVTRPGSVDWLIANAQSAGTGLNLTHWSNAIYYSNSYNAAERWQSEDRIHRIGQEKPCLYVDLVTPRTIDTAILSALREKRNFHETITDLRRVLEEH